MKTKKYYIVDGKVMTEWETLKAGFNLWDGKARYIGQHTSKQRAEKKMVEMGVIKNESK